MKLVIKKFWWVGVIVGFLFIVALFIYQNRGDIYLFVSSVIDKKTKEPAEKAQVQVGIEDNGENNEFSNNVITDWDKYQMDMGAIGVDVVDYGLLRETVLNRGNDDEMLWNLLHPDEKKMWSSEEEFLQATEEKWVREKPHFYRGIESVDELKAKICKSWQSKSNDQIYHNVVMVNVVRKAYISSHTAVEMEQTQYYQMIDGKYYYFMDQSKDSYSNGYFAIGGNFHYECNY